MKWFKHISASGDDPDIGAIISEFGFKGFYIFFRTLEIMSREFDVNNPGKNNFNLKWFLDRFPRRIKAKMVLKCLQFCSNFDAESLSKPRIIAEVQGNRILLNCPKLKDLADNYTEKILRSQSEVDSSHRSKKKEVRSINKEKHKDKRQATGSRTTWLSQFFKYVDEFIEAADKEKDISWSHGFDASTKPYDALLYFAVCYKQTYKENPNIQKGKHLAMASHWVTIYKELLPLKIGRFFKEHTVTWIKAGDRKTVEIFNVELPRVNLTGVTSSLKDAGRSESYGDAIMKELRERDNVE